jgi:hypothetical protein
MEQAIVVGTVVLFVAFLLWNGLRRAPLRRAVRERLSTPDGADSELEGLLEQLRNGAKTGPILRKIRKRVANEPSPTVQAIYLCAAGDVLRRTVSRKGTALRYYMKALKVDPACVGARHGLRALLLAQRRGFKLEQIYWQLLSLLDYDAHGCEAVSDAWRELADLLERRRSGRYRAKAIRRMLAMTATTTECDDDGEPLRDCSED